VTPERWQRIKRVFQAAAERPASERDEYIASATEGDGELRRVIEKMLRHAWDAGPLDAPAWEGLRMDAQLESGARVGPYAILEEVGAGGMGRVYKARDTRLGRTVAIKVLNAEFSHRLRLEGSAISALNHPHVCALYDIGEQDGAAYLVMEYAEGETLKARLARGTLSAGEVLRYGAEIADALAEAHAQGIVHCDLKPANIMITASGAKVLDFGVARMLSEGDTPTDGLGGTAAYMSPSQLNGNPAEARSDIFALGLVLNEMTAGAAHSAGSFPLSAKPAMALGSLIERCLRRDSAGRFQRMEEVRDQLDRLRAVAAKPARRWNRPAQAAAILGLMAATAFLTSKIVHRPAPPPAAAPVPQFTTSVPAPPVATTRVSVSKAARPRVAPPPELPYVATLAAYPGTQRDASFSPDGKLVAFALRRVGRSGFSIAVKPVASTEAPVDLTYGAAEDWGPAWSPDGRRIGFQRRARAWGIYYVDAKGGAEKLVSPVARQRPETLPQISWSHDGRWIAAPDRNENGTVQIYLFGVATGEKRPLTSNYTGTDHAPAFSPDGKSLAYASCAGEVQPCDLYVIDLDRNLLPRRWRRITDVGVYIRGISWLPNGRELLYSAAKTASQDTWLWRVSVDAPGRSERIEIAGPRTRHPAISMRGGLLAYTHLGSWTLMMVRNFR
jgi:serine/threonine protein kinase/Tol biopolymer transport system component